MHRCIFSLKFWIPSRQFFALKRENTLKYFVHNVKLPFFRANQCARQHIPRCSIFSIIRSWSFQEYNPYSASLWTQFAFNFRNCKPEALSCALRRWFEVRWEALILAPAIVGQTSKSDHFGPISGLLKLIDCLLIGLGIGKKLTEKSYFSTTRPFQAKWGGPQVLGFRRMTHRWIRQDQSFQSHVESAPYDKPESVQRLISENQRKTLKFEQKCVTSEVTKLFCPKILGNEEWERKE